MRWIRASTTPTAMAAMSPAKMLFQETQDVKRNEATSSPRVVGSVTIAIVSSRLRRLCRMTSFCGNPTRLFVNLISIIMDYVFMKSVGPPVPADMPGRDEPKQGGGKKFPERT